jgi:YebC/PmpR family DNA-binding regulatory protein
MAGHSKFKNIQHRKGAQDKKRAKLFTKILREISSAKKSGNVDPNHNPRLRAAILLAKTQNLPKDRIEKALSYDASDTTNFDEIRYEGYGPASTAIIVEALTDNKNRTASDVRSSFTKFGGNLGETGSVNFMFDRLGYISYDKKIATDDDFFQKALDFGAEDIVSDDETHTAYCLVENYHNLIDKLHNAYGDSKENAIIWKPKNIVEITDIEIAKKIMKFVDALEDSDDVQNVYGNYEFSDKIYQELMNEE